MTQKDTLSNQVKQQDEQIQELRKEQGILEERARKAEREAADERDQVEKLSLKVHNLDE